MSEGEKPVFHMIAGPNGAGKTTLYKAFIRRRFPQAEFVNADELTHQAFGHAARTREESAHGQALAEARRRELMASGKSLVTESTFSHPSKLDLLRDARKAGYRIVVYHVHVSTPGLAVRRVEGRVRQGGHPVPEDRIRGRFERNPPLIREAARLADTTFVFDNSTRGRAHVLVMVLEHGKAVRVGDKVPSWARALYAEELFRDRFEETP